MNIGIIVFAYNRSQHLKKVLEGSKLYIFQDGLKCEKHRSEWEKTQQVIGKTDWCEVVYTRSKYNKGLADSIVDGINMVFEENDAVIVLEDDCVPTANFVSFMQQCFEKYQNDQVYSVSGYSWPIDLPENKYDIYGCGRISSWGWGTWKKRWKEYHKDNAILGRLKADENKSRNLATWGTDLEQMLLDRIDGKNNSWAVYWGLITIENRGICINPYKSLIHNIGMDGSGIHCSITNRFETTLSSGIQYNFNLPESLSVLDTTKLAFADLYGSYTAISTDDMSKENTIIYGVGHFFYTYEKEINNSYNILALIDREKRGWHAGKRVISLNDINNYDYDSVIIMVQSIQQCIEIARNMIYCGVEPDSIILGYSLYGEWSKMIDKMGITSEGELIIEAGGSSIKIRSEDEFNSFCERTFYHNDNPQ